jgi:hypothetical protein
MFQTDLLSIIWGLNTIYTAIGICHAEISAWQIPTIWEIVNLIGFYYKNIGSIFHHCSKNNSYISLKACIHWDIL